MVRMIVGAILAVVGLLLVIFNRMVGKDAKRQQKRIFHFTFPRWSARANSIGFLITGILLVTAGIVLIILR